MQIVIRNPYSQLQYYQWYCSLWMRNKTQETPFKLCSLLFQTAYLKNSVITCPEKISRSCQPEYEKEVSRDCIAIARTGWAEKHPSSIAKTQLLLWICFVLSTVSFQFCLSRSLGPQMKPLTLFPPVSAESKKLSSLMTFELDLQNTIFFTLFLS